MLEQPHVRELTAQPGDVIRARRLPFAGAKNFRDLGGYPSMDGRSVRWGVLYRSDALHKLTTTDLRYMSALGLDQIIDFRSSTETKKEPDRLPEELNSRLVKIPILDSSTDIFQNAGEEFVKVLKSIDAPKFMIDTNIQLATHFTPEMRKFIEILISSGGRPVLFHCAAGKDRTGFAAALILRLLGVQQEVVMEDYLLTNKYFYSVYRWSLTVLRLLRGKRAAASVRAFMLAEPAYLSAAFEAIDRVHGSFENYMSIGLALTANDVEHLKELYLE